MFTRPWSLPLLVLVLAPACAEQPELAHATAHASGSFNALTYNVAGLPDGISGWDPVRCIPLISPLLAFINSSTCPGLCLTKWVIPKGR